jgi:hypothetical protein
MRNIRRDKVAAQGQAMPTEAMPRKPCLASFHAVIPVLRQSPPRYDDSIEPEIMVKSVQAR